MKEEQSEVNTKSAEEAPAQKIIRTERYNKDEDEEIEESEEEDGSRRRFGTFHKEDEEDSSSSEADEKENKIENDEDEEDDEFDNDNTFVAGGEKEEFEEMKQREIEESKPKHQDVILPGFVCFSFLLVNYLICSFFSSVLSPFFLSIYYHPSFFSPFSLSILSFLSHLLLCFYYSFYFYLFFVFRVSGSARAVSLPSTSPAEPFALWLLRSLRSPVQMLVCRVSSSTSVQTSAS